MGRRLAPLFDLIDVQASRVLRAHVRGNAIDGALNVLCAAVHLLDRALPGAATTPIRIPRRRGAPPAIPAEALTRNRPKQPRKRPPTRKSEVREDWLLTGTQEEYEGCRTLLLELVRRAAYDWVLYRESDRPDQRELADDAQKWLFEDHPAPAPRERQRRGEDADDEEPDVTRFLSICDTLDLDPEELRTRFRDMTPKDVVSVGRPAEYRRRKVHADAADETPVALSGASAWSAFESGASGLDSLTSGHLF